MQNYFAGSSDHPYHISVGAVLLDINGRIACHHFKQARGLSDYYSLMHETLEPNESLEQALARGLMEEFGATATLKTYIGSRVAFFDASDGTAIQKTCLYFTLTVDTLDETKRHQNDREAGSRIEWLPASELAEKLRSQAARLGRKNETDAEIIDRMSSDKQ